MAGILFSCVNDLDTIQKVTYDPDAPDEVTKDLKVHYTDSGYARVQIYASLAETYSKPQHITKLKDYVKIDFFSDEGVIVSSLTALYGEINFETGLMTVRDSVIMLNLEDNQSLETEELFYNQRDSTVFTEKYVIIKEEGKGIVGRGRGIRTSPFDTFRKGDIYEPEGQI